MKMSLKEMGRTSEEMLTEVWSSGESWDWRYTGIWVVCIEVTDMAINKIWGKSL